MSDPLKELLIQKLTERNAALNDAQLAVNAFLGNARDLFLALTEFVSGTGATVTENPVNNIMNFYGLRVPYEQTLHIRLDSGFFDLTARIHSGGQNPRHSMFVFDVSASKYSDEFSAARHVMFNPKDKSLHLSKNLSVGLNGPEFSGHKIAIDSLKKCVIEALA